MASTAPLLENLLLLTRTLRRLGLETGSRQTEALARAWRSIDLGHPAEARSAARAVLCARREEIPPFEHAYDLFLVFSPFRPRQVGWREALRDLTIRGRQIDS
jgi:uncharacterized protein with von Willebrand factor type A (vWA) domain